MLGQTILSWFRRNADPQEQVGDFSTLSDIHDRSEPRRAPKAAHATAAADPPDRDPLAGLIDADVELLSESGSLQVFSIKFRTPAQSAFDYLTLDEALKEGGFKISEVDQGGSVPTIKVSNPSDQMALLVTGEMLVGCKQDRMLNKSIMVAAKSEVFVPVSCVEAGRWNDSSRGFSSSSRSSHATLRKMVVKRVSDSYRRRGNAASDQSEVWSEIRLKMARMGSDSATGALNDVYEDFNKPLSKTLDELEQPRDCHGVVFAVNGTIEGADLFDRPETLTKVWPKLARAYAIDALEASEDEPERVTSEAVTSWLRSAVGAKTDWFHSPGLGKDGRIEGEGLHGSALVVEEGFVHIDMFSSQMSSRRARDPLAHSVELDEEATAEAHTWFAENRPRMEQEQAEANRRRIQELTETHRALNDRCVQLNEEIELSGIACPHCGDHSKNIRFVDNRPAGTSYFVCHCGRSFDPPTLEDSEPVSRE